MEGSALILLFFSALVDLNSPLLFGRLNGLSSDSTVDILYQMGTTQDAGTKDRYPTAFSFWAPGGRDGHMAVFFFTLSF